MYKKRLSPEDLKKLIDALNSAGFELGKIEMSVNPFYWYELGIAPIKKESD
jgi:hypothetical protein